MFYGKISFRLFRQGKVPGKTRVADRERKGVKYMKTKKNLLGKIALIPAVAFLLLDGFNRLPAPFVAFAQLKDIIASDPLYALQLSSTCFLGYFEFAFLLVWLIWYWKDRENVRIPAVLTLIYWIFSFGNQIMNYLLLHSYDSLSDAVRDNWSKIALIVIWVVPVIGTKLPYRVFFAILRGIMLLVQMMMDFRTFKLQMGGMLSGGSASGIGHDIYGTLYFTLYFIVRVLLIIYIVYPKTFRSSDGSGQTGVEAGKDE